MLDELGNLQSEGHGIANLETMLSIGLGQEQQFSATSCILKRYTDLFLYKSKCYTDTIERYGLSYDTHLLETIFV